MTVQLDEVLSKVVIRCPDPRKFTILCVVQIVANHKEVFLQVSCTEPDNFHPDEQFTVIRGCVVLAEYATAQDANLAVREVLHYVAKHEVDETYEYDGRLVFNPHDTWTETEYP